MKRAYLYVIDFVLPLPMTALMFVLWRNADPWTFALLLLAGLALMGAAALQYVIKDRCER